MPTLLSKLRVFAPLEQRDFRTLWLGMVASLLGDGIFLVALAWEVYSMSNAPSALAFVGVAITLPQVLLLLVGGVVSDRFDRRTVMIVADVVRGLAIGLIGVLAVAGDLTLLALVALMVLYGAASAFFGPAFDAIVPMIVPSERLTEANALDQLMRPAAVRLAGPALGGVIVGALGSGPAFLIDAASFGISALCVSRIMTSAIPAGESDGPELSIAAAREGLRFVRAHVWLWGTFIGATVSYLLFIGPAEVLLPYVVKNSMHDGAGMLGVIFGAGGVGALLAAIVTGQRGMPRNHITWMYIVWAAATLAIAGYGLAVWPWQLALACFMFNSLEAAGTVWWATTKGRMVPASLLGRVSSFDWFISTALVPLSYALTAPLAAAIGPRGTLVAVGVVGAATTLAPLGLRGMRDLERSGLALDRVDALAPVGSEPGAA